MQWSVSEKSFLSFPPMSMPSKSICVPLWLTAVTTCGALLVPTFWLPKLRLVGETPTTVPLPESSMTCGFEEALSTIVIRPLY